MTKSNSKKSKPDQMVFVPLGGVGEIGMNMAAYGFGPEGNRKWLVVDCGVTFGGPHQPGIELIMADSTFLEDRAENVVGLVLTHAHEDHYGAVLDLWPDFEKPVYATAFTAAMLNAKRASDGINVSLDIQIMKQGKPFEVGPFTVEAVPVVHSIPESNALYIKCPAGRAVHTGDWKLEEQPVSGLPTDRKRFEAIGNEGTPLALVCDSTNALKEGTSPDESEVAKNLEKIIREAPNRVAFTVFASNLGRVISIAKAAQKAGREVVLAGRSLHRITTVGRELGMLDDLPTLHDQDAFQNLSRKKICLICTGSQGESRAAIARIAREEHPIIDLDAGDRVVFSSWAIPGNEKEVQDIQNRLIDKGVDVITNRDDLVHVTGHPRREELRTLYGWLKPSILVPVHGEAAHLTAHAALGNEVGIESVMPIRNGDMVTLFPEPDISPREVRTGQLYLDGDILCTPDESGARGRRRLSFGGMVVVSLCIGPDGNLRGSPQIVIDGLPKPQGDEDGADEVVDAAIRAIFKSIPKKRKRDHTTVQQAIRSAIRNEMNAWWGKRPNVEVLVHQLRN